MVRVLVPLAVLDGESVSPGLIDFLGTVDVTALGYRVLPEQTPPDQARAQFEERATDAMEDVCEEFREAGGDADHRLVFTHDRRKSIDRVAAETGSDAYAITGPTGEVERLLVSLTGDVSDDRIVDFVASVVGDRDVEVTLVVGDADDTGRLDEAATRLAEAGVEVSTEPAEGDGVEAILEAVPGHDAVVLGETAPSLSSLVFGDAPERVASGSVGPVLVVRREAD